MKKQTKGSTRAKRPMSEAQKRALAAGRAKRHGKAGDGATKQGEPGAPTVPGSGVEQNTPVVEAKGPKKPARRPAAPKPPPEPPKAPEPPAKPPEPPRRMLSESTVVIPAFGAMKPEPEPEPDPQAEAEVIAHQRLYESEKWQVVVNGKLETTATADECWLQANRARADKTATVAILDPDGNQLADRAAEEQAKRWAKQARNWRVERQNGGVQTVIFRGRMDPALDAFERNKDRVGGATLVLFDGADRAIRQVCKPQFRTTINGPENEIEVDSVTYKKYLEAAQDKAAQDEADRTGVPVDPDSLQWRKTESRPTPDPCPPGSSEFRQAFDEARRAPSPPAPAGQPDTNLRWNGTNWEILNQAHGQAQAASVPDFAGIMAAVAPTTELEHVADAIAITRALLQYLESRQAEIQGGLVAQLRVPAVRDYALGRLLDHVRKL